MGTHGSVTRLVEDLRSGDLPVRNRAAQQIWEALLPRAAGVARNNLDRRIRRRVDEEDVLQSMYKSFCLRQQRGEFDLANRDALWRLLVTITQQDAGCGQEPGQEEARHRPRSDHAKG